MNLIANGCIEIYNEFSLQHELGIFLRASLLGYKVEFERNVEHFGLQKQQFVKKEIDISLISNTGEHSGIVELKYPRNGQIPEQMFSFCKDIMFVEQLVCAKFKTGAFVVITDDPLFYSGKTEGIYSLFRSGKNIHGEIVKPTGAKDSIINIQGNYQASWRCIKGTTKWCMIEVTNSQIVAAAPTHCGFTPALGI